MAVKILGVLNGVINKTATEILEGQVINRMTDIVTTFLNSSVEAIRDLTREETTGEEGTGEGTGETP